MGKKKDEDYGVSVTGDAAVIERGAWGNQLEFVLTCVGYAVGLGNVWRFPYLTFANGGGAFLLPYFLMLFCVGIPVFFFELCFGQFASLGHVAIWIVNPIWKGIGVAMTVVTTIVSIYYSVLMTYIIYFFFASMNSKLPWEDCDNGWNTINCLTTEEVANKTYFELYLNETNLTRQEIKTPSEEYFYNEVLDMSDGIDEMGTVVWHLSLCLLLCWIINFLVLIKGIATLGKVVYFTSTFPYIMMTVMVIRGVTLDGASLGIEYYLTPDFDRLTDSVVWSDAASQIFFSLSTCTGGLISMASYNKFKNNTYRDSFLIPLINCATSFYAGFAIFSVLGFMAKSKGVDVPDVAQSGPGLVFVVYPEGITQMPAAPVWAVLFFFMMVTLGFSSHFSMVEAVFVVFMDQFPSLRTNTKRQIIFRAVGCIIFFFLTLPMVTNGGFYLFSIADSYAGGLPRLFTGLFEIIAVVWIYGFSRFSEDIAMMLGKKPNLYFKITWLCVTPGLIVGIVAFRAVEYEPLTLFNDTYQFPGWAEALGWLMVAGVVSWIPIGWVVQWFRYGGWEIIKKASTPTDAWGPALLVNKTGRYAPRSRFTDPESNGHVSEKAIHNIELKVDSGTYDNEAFTQF